MNMHASSEMANYVKKNYSVSSTNKSS